MKITQIFVLAVLTATTSLAQAAVFQDNFDSYQLQLDWTPPSTSGWTVFNGTVDIIGNTFAATSYDFLPGHGGYVDLDGSKNKAGYLFNIVNLVGGTKYSLSFDLAGSQRGSSEDVGVTFGGSTSNYTLASSDSFQKFFLDFTPGSTGEFSIMFKNKGGDNIGALLDNVSVTAVPEPEIYALMLGGLALVGFSARRRSNKTKA
jgi:hypothetical protein